MAQNHEMVDMQLGKVLEWENAVRKETMIGLRTDAAISSV